MSCDIVIPVYNQLDYTRECLESIKRNTGIAHRIIIVDDASGEETRSYLEEFGKKEGAVILRNEKNLGWVGSVNRGLLFSGAEYVCVMNNDTVVYPAWLSEMCAVAGKNALFGIVNPEWEIAGGFRGNRDEYFEKVIRSSPDRFAETDWARGFCFLIKRAVIERIGGLDELFSPGYYDDWDYSLRAVKAGFIIVRAKGAFVWHYRNVTYKKKLGEHDFNRILAEKEVIFRARWGNFGRALFVLGGKAGTDDAAFRKLALFLLRSQCRVAVLTSRSGLEFEHTNCRIAVRPEFWLRARALLNILDNSRFGKPKRYGFIIASEDIAGFLNGLPFIKKRYSIFSFSSALEAQAELTGMFPV